MRSGVKRALPRPGIARKMSDLYRLRCSLLGHSMDVRSICTLNFLNDAIVTGSRDTTSRLWVPAESSQNYKEFQCFKGHTNFVSAVCALNPDDNYPGGLVITGSNDNTICAFSPSSSEPVYRLVGHSDTVCALDSGKFGTVLSGSWDKTAKVWLGQKCLLTLSGHTAAVWAVKVMPEHGIMLTGSADKTLKIWRAGQCEKTFSGHTDCVRGVAALNANEFFSCANDGTVRHWMITGECISTYAVHESFIYGIDVLACGSGFVSCGEDRTLRVWKHGECKQIISIPAMSVWSVAVLANGDIIAGSSDGVARVFTCDKSRQASVEEIKAYDEELSNAAVSSGEIGDIKVEELPGKEALYEPGKRDGQTKLVRVGGKIEVHQWSAAESSWLKLGDCVGGAGTKGKKMFEGKEYDYVFDVDVDETRPQLKLPYNSGDDPWLAAQKFLDRNYLDQMFLDQVANFIIKNSKEGGASSNQQLSSEFTDPFTGGSRYQPASGEGAAVKSNNTEAADPFTGSGRYRPQASSNDTQDVHMKSESAKFYPQTTIVTFDTANAAAILGKLKEFNSNIQIDNVKLDDSICEVIVQLCCVNSVWKSAQLSALERALQWPRDKLFPALDILRLAVRSTAVNDYFCKNPNDHNFINYLLTCFAHKDTPANQMLSLRTLCNLMSNPAGENLAVARREDILNAATDLVPTDNKHIQVALATLVLNFSVIMRKSGEIEGKSHCLSSIANMLNATSDYEAQFRQLVAIGTLISDDPEGMALAKSLDLHPIVEKFVTVKDPVKISECSRALVKCFMQPM